MEEDFRLRNKIWRRRGTKPREHTHFLDDVGSLLDTKYKFCPHSQNRLHPNLNQNALRETLPSLGLPIFGLRFGLSKTLQTFSVSFKPRWRISSFCLNFCDILVV